MLGKSVSSMGLSESRTKEKKRIRKNDIFKFIRNLQWYFGSSELLCLHAVQFVLKFFSCQVSQNDDDDSTNVRGFIFANLIIIIVVINYTRTLKIYSNIFMPNKLTGNVFLCSGSACVCGTFVLTRPRLDYVICTQHLAINYSYILIAFVSS